MIAPLQCAAKVCRRVAVCSSGCHSIPEHLPAIAQGPMRRFQRAPALNAANYGQKLRGGHFGDRSFSNPRKMSRSNRRRVRSLCFVPHVTEYFASHSLATACAIEKSVRLLARLGIANGDIGQRHGGNCWPLGELLPPKLPPTRTRTSMDAVAPGRQYPQKQAPVRGLLRSD